MLNDDSLCAVNRAANALSPFLYGTYSFDRIPAITDYLLGIERWDFPSSLLYGASPPYKKVVQLFIDGLGWHQLHYFIDRLPALKELVKSGVLSLLTSLFPSTTAAHVTYLHTELYPAFTGIYEWFYYEPEADNVCAPLLFSLSDQTERDGLGLLGYSPAQFFPFPSRYLHLRKHHIESYLLYPLSYAHSSYTRTITQGATSIGYPKPEEGFIFLQQLLATPHESSQLISLYIDTIDHSAHHYGSFSSSFFEQLKRLDTLLERYLLPHYRRNNDTAWLLFADHGHIAVNSSQTYYLNELIPHFAQLCARTKEGKMLAAQGSPRDLFMRVSKSKENETLDILNDKVSHIAEVIPIRQAVARGLFGSFPPSSRFWERIGDILLLPRAPQALWWYEDRAPCNHLASLHGGLTPEEIHVPLLFLG